MKEEYIIQAFSANLDLLEIIALTTLAYILTKKEEGSKKTIVYLLVLARFLFPVVSRWIKEENVLGQDECCANWSLLGIKAGFSIVLY